MKGKVKFYNRSKDFGFIASETGEEYYFNIASLKLPQDNDPVEFEIYKTGRGEIARQVLVNSLPGKKTGRKKQVVSVVVAVVLIVLAFCIGHWV